MLRRLRRISSSSPATTVRTRSISRARAGIGAAPGDAAARIDDASLDRGKQERAGGVERAELRQVDDELLRLIVGECAENALQPLLELARLGDHPLPGGKQEQSAGLEMMLELRFHATALPGGLPASFLADGGVVPC